MEPEPGFTQKARAALSVRIASGMNEFLRDMMISAPGQSVPILHRGALASMQKQGLVEISAALTPRGRWAAIASEMGLPFFSLCALADFYCMQKSAGFAVSPKFRERFEPCYSAKHLNNTISALSSAGLILRAGRMAWKLSPATYKDIRIKYDSDMVALKEWLDQAQDKMEEDILSEQPALEAAQNMALAGASSLQC